MPVKPTYEELEKRIHELEKAESERKRYKKELIHSYKLMDYIISHARISIAVHDRDLNYMYVSKRYLEEYKVQNPNVIGKHHYEVFPDLPQKWRDVHQRSLKGEVLSAEEDPYYRDDGSVDWTRWECRPWYDADGSIGGIIIYTEIINDRRKIEETLENERSFLSVVLDNIQEAIVICDAEGKLLRFNEAARNLHGIGEQPIEPDKWTEHYDLYKMDGITPLPMEDIPLFRALNKEHVQNAEIVVAPKNSIFHYLVCNGQALKNDVGEVIGAVIAMHDITERKKAEDSLKNQTKTLNDILEKAADGICVCHNISEEPHVRFTHWNPRMTEITGYTMEEINQAGWYQSMYPDPEVQQKAITRMSKMRQGDDIQTEEWVIATKDGTQKTLSISTSVLKENNGEIHVLALMQDVSERKRFEEQLIFSRKEWEDIFQAIGQPTIILDPEHGIIKANKATLKITGLPENQLKGKKCCEIFHNSHKPPESCPMEALLHEGSLETVEMEMEALDGTFLVSCTPIIDNNGNLKKIIHIATDITEKIKFEEQLRQSHKMEAIGTLAGGVAHEFNNILAIILGNAEMAIEEIPEGNLASEFLGEIQTASLRGRDVVRNILSIARKTMAARKPVQVNSIVKDSIKLLRATIPATIDIHQNLFCESEMILADITEFNQVLMNLLTNSAHAIGKEPGIIEVKLETITLNQDSAEHYEDLKQGDYAKITVNDTGKGIEPDLIDRVFDPYFTTKDVDQGLGVGLAVVYGIVKKHDGAIRIESEIGKGTTVEVLFPLIEEQAQEKVEKPDAMPSGTECILFVDDDASLAIIAKQMLEHLKYDVIEKTDSFEALKLFKSKPDKFDLVITDMAMPNLAGDRLSKELLKIRPDIPIILCTGHSDYIDENSAKKLGIKAYAIKPVAMMDLADTVRRVLDEAKATQQ